MAINKLIKFSPFLLLSKPSILSDNVNIKITKFINAANKNRYLQLIFRNKTPLTKIGAMKAPNVHPIPNLISALLTFNGETSLIMEVEFTTIIPQDMPNII